MCVCVCVCLCAQAYQFIYYRNVRNQVLTATGLL